MPPANLSKLSHGLKCLKVSKSKKISIILKSKLWRNSSMKKSVQLTALGITNKVEKFSLRSCITISTKRRSLCCGESSFTAKLWQNISAKVYLTTMCRVKNDAHQQTTMTTTKRIAKDSNSVASPWWHNAY